MPSKRNRPHPGTGPLRRAGLGSIAMCLGVTGCVRLALTVITTSSERAYAGSANDNGSLPMDDEQDTVTCDCRAVVPLGVAFCPTCLRGFGDNAGLYGVRAYDSIALCGERQSGADRVYLRQPPPMFDTLADGPNK